LRARQTRIAPRGVCRSNAKEESTKLDKQQITTGDFAIMLTGVSPKTGTIDAPTASEASGGKLDRASSPRDGGGKRAKLKPEAFKRMVQEALEGAFGVRAEDIAEIEVGVDCKEAVSTVRQLARLRLLEHELQAHRAQQPDVANDRRLRFFLLQFLFCRLHFSAEWLRRMWRGAALDSVTELVEAQLLTAEEDLNEFLKERAPRAFTGHAFVVFQTTKARAKCFDAYRGQRMEAHRFGGVRLAAAPEPDEVLWEHLATPEAEKQSVRARGTWYTLVLILLSSLSYVLIARLDL
jgi:hypothetical protein